MTKTAQPSSATAAALATSPTSVITSSSEGSYARSSLLGSMIEEQQRVDQHLQRRRARAATKKQRNGKRAYEGDVFLEEEMEDRDDDADDDDDDDDDDEDDIGGDEDGYDEGNVSAFTDPSWYGSPFARRGSSGQWATSQSDGEMGDNGKATQKLDTYQKGVRLARRTLLEMDEELDRLHRQQERGKGKASEATATQLQHLEAPSCGTDILASFDSCPTYACASCGTTLALQDELISKAFSGRDGKAYLFFTILNIHTGPKEDRQLLTGLHTVADLSCAICQRSVGWSYLRAFEASQRYKEGKFILERASLHKSNNWRLSEDDEAGWRF